MIFEWERSTQRDKIALYETVRPLLRRRGWDWKTFWKNIGLEVGEDYERNFRRGEISSSNAQRVFDWMTAGFPETTKHLLEVLCDVRDSLDPNSPWESFITKHGEFTNLELAEVNLPRYTTRPAYDSKATPTPIREPIPIQQTVKFYQRFTFRIESPFNGQALGLQRSGGVWWPIPLIDTQLKRWPSIPKGTSWMPYHPESSETTAPRWLLSESEEPGLHLMAFVIVKDGASFSNHYSNIERVRMDWLDKLAVEIEKLPKDTWRVFRRNVLFKPLDEP